MFIPSYINGCIFTYKDKIYQFHYDADDNSIEFECYSEGERAGNIELLVHLVNQSLQNKVS
ncbi:hypothetical protein [Vibrio parahaemolyticus]|uniref:hypothetical protein n=1 Tax=Vibrio parahaemolyticus TaxID=670 RepID=UPI00041403FA|nr:hypothetical protein [Vibrio parahaemolyticus]TOB58420.1 hypothetical protein CGK02_23090 [Vibrio parahaemolyticus]TOJ30651.1 hypothetical protein CGI43_03155 [Vibrio parahaemolyticus]HCH6231663.1 hypothetical protein [Vibrio parahaemolyticus]HCM1461415.1 hypothetical protein [Vibrio parahaemolyticus]HCM1465550.1 hypothetical protein [Vibrio parahaemolyticus]